MLKVLMGFLMCSVLMRITGAVDDSDIAYPSALLLVVSLLVTFKENK